MKKVGVGINGFGRIGRQILRCLWERHLDVWVAAVGVTENDQTLATRALLLEYDSTYGQFPYTVAPYQNGRARALLVDGQAVPLVVQNSQEPIPWPDYGVEVVIDATGQGKKNLGAVTSHLASGVKCVIVTCPIAHADITLVYGINHQRYDTRQHRIVSAGSCTTMCLSTVVKVLDDVFGLEEGFATTVHAYTNSQNLQDSAHKDPRRARAAVQNIIPTNTGAAKTIGKVLPELRGRLSVAALRVPVSSVSTVELVACLREPATADEINQAFTLAATDTLKGILAVSDKPLVSSDYVGNPHSATIDALSTITTGSLVRVLAWYDNEWGYACRVVDLVDYIIQGGR